jgi:hypothetical protein
LTSKISPSNSPNQSRFGISLHLKKRIYPQLKSNKRLRGAADFLCPTK